MWRKHTVSNPYFYNFIGQVELSFSLELKSALKVPLGTTLTLSDLSLMRLPGARTIYTGYPTVTAYRRKPAADRHFTDSTAADVSGRKDHHSICLCLLPLRLTRIQWSSLITRLYGWSVQKFLGPLSMVSATVGLLYDESIGEGNLNDVAPLYYKSARVQHCTAALLGYSLSPLPN